MREGRPRCPVPTSRVKRAGPVWSRALKVITDVPFSDSKIAIQSGTMAVVTLSDEGAQALLRSTAGRGGPARAPRIEGVNGALFAGKPAPLAKRAARVA